MVDAAKTVDERFQGITKEKTPLIFFNVHSQWGLV
jgi:hypothetical protein